MYQSFRTSWQMVIRPSTSFPLPPLKFRTAGFPQYGFKPVPAAATFASCTRLAYRPSLSAGRLPACFPAVSGAGVSVPSTGPVALGSPSGYIVRSAQRLLWPHLRLCGHPSVYDLCHRVAGRPAQPQRVPNLLCQSFHLCRRPYSGGPIDCL
jgi:hypothetical protein